MCNPPGDYNPFFILISKNDTHNCDTNTKIRFSAFSPTFLKFDLEFFWQFVVGLFMRGV